jgi:Zn-dependent peptidase ImmA (M78 family)
MELAEALNIIVVKQPLIGVKGFYQNSIRNKLIYINSNLDEVLQKVVCAHELGHAILHTKLNIVFLEKNTLFIKDKYENEANLFCTYLLLPYTQLNDYDGLTYEQIAAAAGIPIDYLRLVI